MVAETNSRNQWITLGLASLTSICVGIWIGSNLSGKPEPASQASAPKPAPIQVPITASGTKSDDPLEKSLYVAPLDTPLVAAKPPTTEPTKPPEKTKDPITGAKVSKLPAVGLPNPLQGDIQPFRPNPDQATVDPRDVHAAEATLRSTINTAKGTVLEANDADGVRTFLVKVNPKKVQDITDRLTDRIPQLAGVAEVTNRSRLPASERKEDSYGEVLRLETSMIDLRKRLLQAQIDFLPNAPAIKEVEEDIARTQKKITQLNASQSNSTYLEIRLRTK